MSASETPAAPEDTGYPPAPAAAQNPGGYPPAPAAAQNPGGYPPAPGAQSGYPPAPGAQSGYPPAPGAPGGYPPAQGVQGGYPPAAPAYTPAAAAPGGYPPAPGMGYPPAGQPQGGYPPAGYGGYQPTGYAPQPSGGGGGGGGGGLLDLLGSLGGNKSGGGGGGGGGGGLGALGGAFEDLDKYSRIANTAMQGVSAIQGVVKSVEGLMATPTMDALQGGSIIQLSARATMKCLQILAGQGGQLILDGNGAEGPTAYNAHFTIIREPNNIVQLHNKNNFIAISQDQVLLYPGAQGGYGTPNCRFKIAEPKTGLLTFESVEESGKFLAVGAGGQMKQPSTSSSSDKEARFLIKFIYAPYGPPPTAPAQ